MKKKNMAAWPVNVFTTIERRRDGVATRRRTGSMDMCALCSPLVHGFGARFVDKNAALNCRSWTTTAVPVAVVVAVHVPVAVAVAVNVNVDVDVVLAVACVSF